MGIIEDIYELSPGQHGLLFHALYTPQEMMYFNQLVYSLHGTLDISAFKKAWQQVIDRHPALRTTFFWENLPELDKPLQIVNTGVQLPYDHQDWRALSSNEQEEQLDVFLQTDRKQGFDLTQAPLLRISIMNTREDEYYIILSYHHLVIDGWSLSIILKEVFAFYEAYRDGYNLHLLQPRSYRNYITWLQQQNLSKAEAYWHQMLQGFTAPTPLGIDHRAGVMAGHQAEGDHYQQLHLSATTTSDLQLLARRMRVTLNILLQGAWALLLSSYSGEQDIVYGVAVSGRPATLPEVDSIVGMFVNTLPMRVQVPPQMQLCSWLQTLQEQQVDLCQYEYSPLVQIQQWSEVPHPLPLFESVFVFGNFSQDVPQRAQDRSHELALRCVRAIGRTNYPLTLEIVPHTELQLLISYDKHRFDCVAITRMLGHLRTLLENFITHPERSLTSMSCLSQDECMQILVAWNATQVPYPQDQCLHQLFEAQAERTPHATAVVLGKEQLTYQALNERANQLARYLQKFGVGPEIRVGICVNPSLEMPIGLLGILKAGGAYVPLDASYPAERLTFMLQDAQLSVLLTQQPLLAEKAVLGSVDMHIICLDTDWNMIATESRQNVLRQTCPLNLAYVMYTSGSTGKPKAVLMTHQALVNYTLAIARLLRLKSTDRVLQFASISFDVMVEELFPTWASGATVVLCSSIHKACTDFLRILAKESITLFEIPTSYWHELVYGLSLTGLQWPATLRLIIIGGENALPERLETWKQSADSQRITLVNVYGLTETSVTSTLYELSFEEDDRAVRTGLPIGRPIANTQMYLLDEYLNPVPVGIPGEIHIGGVGLARGYHNRPDITAERFIPHPFSQQPGACLYKTGDMARYLPDGTIELLGRTDFQVKVRGFRLELGEIEAMLCLHPDVQVTAVSLWEDAQGEKWLVAYVVPSSARIPTTDELRSFLQEKLPEYMVCSFFVILDRLPLTSNGKLDRGALPPPNGFQLALTKPYVAPSTITEQTIASVWQEVLCVEKVGLYDNIFELGAHSLLMIRAQSKLQAALCRNISIIDLFNYPTISAFAQYLNRDEQDEQQSFQQSQQRAITRKGSAKQLRDFRQRQQIIRQEKGNE